MKMVHKTVASPGDGMEFVLSDATVDRYSDTIEPAGWSLAAFKRNPIALFTHIGSFPIGTWTDIRVEGDRLMGRLQLAARGTSARIDELIGLVEQGILRAVSVGFVPQKSEPHNGGTRFLKQELVEVSLVSVPANPAALAVARGLGTSEETMALAFGEHAERRPVIKRTGGHAGPQSPNRKATPMTFAAQIEDAQARLNAARDALTAHHADENADPDATDGFNEAVETWTRKLSQLERSERALAPRSAPPQQQVLPPLAAPAVARRPLNIPTKDIEWRDYVYRAAAAHLQAYIQRRAIDDVVRDRWGDDEATMLVTRAAQTSAVTTQPSWAQELVQTSNADFMASLPIDSVFNPLSGAGTTLSFGPGQGAIKIPSMAATPSITGSFVGEAQPIPVRRAGLTSITLLPHKMGVITRFSREIAMYSTPAIEGICRDAIRNHTSVTIDTLLLDNAAGTSVRPAGLTNGVAAITAATGGGYSAVLKDIAALTGPFYALNAGRRLVMIMNPAQGLQLSMVPGPAGVQFGWTSQFTSRFQIIESTTVPTGNVYVIDAADFVSVNGNLEFDVSEEATLHIEDTTPQNISGVGAPNVVAAPVESMFQTAQIALRMLVNINWAMRRTGLVQWMTGVNWAPP